MTALIDTLFQLEKYLGLELDSLYPLAQEDDIGGFHPDAAQAKWDVGAIWDVEGKTLFALIRALQPQTVVEIGSGKGCSTTHIVTALALNGGGHLTTIDRGNTPQVPDGLTDWVDILSGDALAWLENEPDASIDFILEDADHSEALCYAIGELVKKKLAPGGVLMSHDGEHWAVGKDVRAGYDRAGLDFRRFLTDPSDCGWLVWQRSKVYSIGVYTMDGGLTYTDVRSDDPEQITMLNEMYTRLVATANALPEGGVELTVDMNEAVLQAQENYIREDLIVQADTEPNIGKVSVPAKDMLQAQGDEDTLPIYALNVDTGRMDHIADTPGQHDPTLKPKKPRTQRKPKAKKK